MPLVLDSLTLEGISPAERFEWQPPELVAVLGEHAWRHWGEVMHVAFCVDGQRVASVGEDGLRVWDRRAGQATPRELFSLPGSCRLVAFSPDWHVVLTVEDSDAGKGVLQVWDLSGTMPASVSQETCDWTWTEQRDGRTVDGCGRATAAAIHPSSRLLAIGHADGVVRVRKADQARGGWDLKLHSCGAQITALTFSLDERLLAIGLADGSVQLWELVGPVPRPTAVYQASTEGVSCLTFNWDGGVLAVASRSGSVRLLRIAQLQVCADCSFNAGSGADAVAFSPDGSLLAVWVDGEGTRVYNITSLIPEQLWEIESQKQQTFLSGQAVAFAPSGVTLALGEQNGTVVLWDLSREEPKHLNPIRSQGSPANWLAFSPDGSLLASSACPTIQSKDHLKNNPIRVWPLRSDGTFGKAIELEGGGPLVFSADGDTLASCDEKKQIRLWKREGDSFRSSPGQRLASLHRQTGELPTANPEGANADGQGRGSGTAELTFIDRKVVYLSGLADGTPVVPPGPKIDGTILAASPDGNWVVSGRLTGLLPSNELQTTSIWARARPADDRSGDPGGSRRCPRPRAGRHHAGVVHLLRPGDALEGG